MIMFLQGTVQKGGSEMVDHTERDLNWAGRSLARSTRDPMKRDPRA
jgi:hypothetical protein